MDQSSLGDVLEGHDIRILGKTKMFFEELSVIEIRNLRKGKHQNEIVARE
jgi:hypothetical protein